ncbi:hypothetical protein FB45DRAFT_829370 [Roridomyces roridus]|uniref:Prolyl 4-hydroxylase alpha subunit domain-containing protein n=1 Tax=Roridomyces roridus TaxID=1738132 RepID=A0AAD7FSS7_9AGAR|nr:hypothetical protein FB45DRAFT_829370 [Roridomyces roridus]
MSSQSKYEPKYIGPGPVDFTAAELPEYDGCYALILDSLFSRAEVSGFLAEAEASSPWEVAQINGGGNYQFTDTSYRNSQRIIYDSFELSAKIFDKIRPHLSDIEEIEEVTNVRGKKIMQRWRMVRMNERLRFLRYPEGGFFKQHMDGYYEDEKTGQRTFYTIQFYLPSDSTGSDESFVPAQGGTTRFFGRRLHRYADVEAVPGRVLVFQHQRLLHTGEEVTGGIKCTVRSDILYEKVGQPTLVTE